MIEIRNLNVFFKQEGINEGSGLVLKNVNLTFKEPASINLIVGESGSGKSTLANALTGIIFKFENVNITGSIFWDGVEYQNLKQKGISNKIGFLPQYPPDFVLNQLVSDEITFPLENLGWKRDTVEKRETEILHAFNIEHLKNRVISEISSGELQKVALATAIAPNPQFLVLDEPFSRIDSKSAIDLLHTIKTLKQEGMIILIFEHHLDHLLEIADRLIILEEGQILIDSHPNTSAHLLNENLSPELMKIKLPGRKKNSYSFKEIYSKLVKLRGLEQ